MAKQKIDQTTRFMFEIYELPGSWKEIYVACNGKVVKFHLNKMTSQDAVDIIQSEIRSVLKTEGSVTVKCYNHKDKFCHVGFALQRYKIYQMSPEILATQGYYYTCELEDLT